MAWQKRRWLPFLSIRCVYRGIFRHGPNMEKTVLETDPMVGPKPVRFSAFEISWVGLWNFMTEWSNFSLYNTTSLISQFSISCCINNINKWESSLSTYYIWNLISQVKSFYFSLFSPGSTAVILIDYFTFIFWNKGPRVLKKEQLARPFPMWNKSNHVPNCTFPYLETMLQAIGFHFFSPWLQEFF